MTRTPNPTAWAWRDFVGKQMGVTLSGAEAEEHARKGHDVEGLISLAARDRRVTELLEANNRYQQEARDARAEVARVTAERDRVIDAGKAVCLAAWTDRHSRLHGHAAVRALDAVITPKPEGEQ